MLININHVPKFIYKPFPIAIIEDSVIIIVSQRNSPEVKILSVIEKPFHISNIEGVNSNIKAPTIKKVKGKEHAVSIESLDN